MPWYDPCMTTYLTTLLGVDEHESSSIIENIEKSVCVARAAATLHEFRRHAYQNLSEQDVWKPLSELDKLWWVQVSALGNLPQGSWRENGHGDVQIRQTRLRLDQLPPSVMLHFYWPQAIAMVHAIEQPGATIESVAKAGYDAITHGGYDEAVDAIKQGVRKVATLVIHALSSGAAVAMQNEAAEHKH